MDRELRAFFGRAKNISLLPQEREELKGAIFAEREGAPLRHTSRMQQLNPALMSTASTIGLSTGEKRRARRELRSFMRSHPVKRAEHVLFPWSLPRMIPLYAPLLVVTLIILANTQQWEKKTALPQPVEESDQEMEDAVSVPIAPLFMEFPYEGERDGQEVLQDEAGQEILREVLSPLPRGEVRRKAEPQGEPEVLPLQQETDGFVAPASQEEPAEDRAAGGGGTPATMQTQSLKSVEPMETNTAPANEPAKIQYQPAVQESQAEGKSSTALQGILTVAEARLESLRQKSLESEEAVSLFKQVEQKLKNARASAEQDEELALQYLRDAEKLMDELERE